MLLQLLQLKVLMLKMNTTALLLERPLKNVQFLLLRLPLRKNSFRYFA